MLPDPRDAAHLWDMLQAARDAVRFTGDLSRDDFVADEAEITRLAVERKLEILGEAARRISPAFRDRHPDIPWRETVGLRNVITHEYGRVNYKEIYGIIRDRLPELIERLARLVPLPPETQE